MQRGFRTVAKQPRNPRAQTPVTRHPLFPAIVALWFGALFGLGSLAIRPGLIESAVLAIGIDTIVPAAAPPLGVTARILIALALAALGGVLGATVARRLAEPRREQPTGESLVERVRVRTRDSHPDAPARRPLSVPDEISAAPLDAAGTVAGAFPGRRRALAIAEEAPQFRAHEYAPLPGGEPHAPVAAAWSEPAAESVAHPAAESDALELGAFAAPLAAEPSPAATGFQEPAQQTFRPLSELTNAAFAAPAPDPAPAFAPPAAEAAEHQMFAAPVAAAAPQQVFAEPPCETPFAAPAAEPAAQSLFAAPPPAPLDFARLGAESPTAYAPPPPPPEVEPVAATAPDPAPDSLDLAALTARFAASLRRRREQQEAAGAEQEAPEALPTFAPGAAAVPEQPVLEAEAAPVPEQPLLVAETAPDEPVAAATPLAMPAAFRPLGFDPADEDDVVELESLVPLRQFRMPPVEVPVVEAVVPVAAVEDAADEDAEPESEVETEGYSSLLELGRPPVQRQSFVRIEEPEGDHAAIEPVVIFPGQAARSAPAAPVPLAVPQPFAAPEPSPAEAAAEPAGLMRRFDAPANALPGQAVAAAGLAPQVDREETERALRAALATLQRMSGAA